MNTTEFPPYKGFAILIKAPGAKRTFVPREGETITITDKHGKELWSFKNPQGQANPGVIIYDVEINLSTEREFGQFAQKKPGTAAARPSLTHPRPQHPTPADRTSVLKSQISNLKSPAPFHPSAALPPSAAALAKVEPPRWSLLGQRMSHLMDAIRGTKKPQIKALPIA